MPLKAIPKWSKEIKTVVHNMYTRDIGLIHSAKLQLAKIRDEVESSESDIWTGRVQRKDYFVNSKSPNQLEVVCLQCQFCRGPIEYVNA